MGRRVHLRLPDQETRGPGRRDGTLPSLGRTVLASLCPHVCVDSDGDQGSRGLYGEKEYWSCSGVSRSYPSF